MNAGIHTISADTYHADQVADQPSLSASIAHVLLTMSPAHARAGHPRLNPGYERKTEEKFELGTVVHALLLQGIDVADVLAFPDYKTTAAKEARDLARSHGRIPLLSHQAHGVEQMVAAVREQLPLFNVTPPLLEDGQPEQTMVWEEAGVLCRARVDWLRNDFAAIDDLKTTSRSANPEAWSRTLFGIGSDVQAAFYLRGIRAIHRSMPTKVSENQMPWIDPQWRWIVCETQPPYALSVIAPGPDVLALADAKVDRALTIWRACLKHDRWPGYPREVCWAELPAWEEARFLAREDVAA